MRIELTHAEVLRDDVIVNASLNLEEGKKRTRQNGVSVEEKKGGGDKEDCRLFRI